MDGHIKIIYIILKLVEIASVHPSTTRPPPVHPSTRPPTSQSVSQSVSHPASQSVSHSKHHLLTLVAYISARPPINPIWTPSRPPLDPPKSVTISPSRRPQKHEMKDIHSYHMTYLGGCIGMLCMTVYMAV
jgi:hypothetical protein